MRKLTLQIHIIPLLNTNYAYVLENPCNAEAIVIDPSVSGPVAEFLETRQLYLKQIWCTHHHRDHVGGVASIVKQFEPQGVLGSSQDLAASLIPYQTRGLIDGEELLFSGTKFRVIHLPGHTLGAIAFYAPGLLFPGDTLFLAGCGRVFTCDMNSMMNSLNRLRQLPSETKIYCGHEYTRTNLEFALTIEPHNSAIKKRLESLTVPSIPGTISEELETNPFLRWDQPNQKHLGKTHLEIFTGIRHAKDLL